MTGPKWMGRRMESEGRRGLSDNKQEEDISGLCRVLERSVLSAVLFGWCTPR